MVKVFKTVNLKYELFKFDKMNNGNEFKNWK